MRGEFGLRHALVSRMHQLHVVEPTNRMNDVGEVWRDHRIAVIGEERFGVMPIGVDPEAMRLLDRIDWSLHVDQQVVGVAVRHREALALRPVHHHLLVMGRRSKACIPFFCREELMVMRGAGRLQVAKEFLFLGRVRHSQTVHQPQRLSGSVVRDELRSSFSDHGWRVSVEHRLRRGLRQRGGSDQAQQHPGRVQPRRNGNCMTEFHGGISNEELQTMQQPEVVG